MSIEEMAATISALSSGAKSIKAMSQLPDDNDEALNIMSMNGTEAPCSPMRGQLMMMSGPIGAQITAQTEPDAANEEIDEED